MAGWPSLEDEFESLPSSGTQYILPTADVEKLVDPRLTFPQDAEPPCDIFQQSKSDQGTETLSVEELVLRDPLLKHTVDIMCAITRVRASHLSLPAAPKISVDEIAHLLDSYPKELKPQPVLQKTIGSDAIQQLLSASVATSCILIGFEDASDSVLKVLSDLLDNFITYLCKKISAHEDVTARGESCFPDALHKGLYDVGISNAMQLRQWYDKFVVDGSRRNEEILKMMFDEFQQAVAEVEENVKLEETTPTS